MGTGNFSVRKASAVALATMCCFATGAVQAATPETPAAASQVIAPDNHVRRGVLPNGLRYAVMRNTTPGGALAIRLGIDVGSYEENDNERGAAHFVEHMAFNSTRNSRDGAVERRFAAAGAGFGRDHNAFTTLTTTTYQLNLQSPTNETTDLAFQWLRDVADGIRFDAAAVDSERGVILAEREARIGPSENLRIASMKFQAPGLRSNAREPTASVDELRALKPINLQRFYERWYRPENAVVVVVGDQPLDALEKRVKDAFADWAPSRTRAVRAPVVTVDVKRGLDFLALEEARAPTALTVCKAGPPPPKYANDIASLRRRIGSTVWRRILDARLAALATSTTPPYLGAQTLANDGGKDVSAVCIVAVAMTDDWTPALAATEAELRRFATHGPREDEVENAVSELRSFANGAVNQAGTRTSADLANGLLVAALKDEVFASPDETLRAFDDAAEGMDAKAALEAFNRDWSGSGPLITLVSPKGVEANLLRAAWAKGDGGAAPEQATARAAAKWAYRSFGRRGKVVNREDHPDFGFVRLRLKNGVIVNFKHTDFEEGSVQVRVRFGAGRREVANDDYVAATLGASMFKAGGLGRHSIEDLGAMFHEVTWDADLRVSDEAFVLGGRTTSWGLEDELNLLTAFVSDPGFRRSADSRLSAAVDLVYRLYRTNPSLVLAVAISDAVSSDGTSRLPPREQMMKLTSGDFERILKGALTQDPLEVTIVGDVDEKTVTSLVRTSFGALPPRAPADRARADTWFQRYPDAPPPVVRTTHEGSPEKAVAGVLWPLYVATPERRREEYALGLAARIMTDKLRDRIREQLGKAYAPEAGTFMPDRGDQGFLMAAAESYPADIDMVVSEMQSAARQLVAGDFTGEDLEAVRRPLLTDLRRDLSTNGLWAAALSGSARDEQPLRDIAGAPALYATITLDEVKAAASRWLSRPPIVVVATPEPDRPAKATSATGSAGPSAPSPRR
jgi:zinc protease